MSDKAATNENFTEDDIFFECPHCGKSMAIDKRGMGLTIECPDCGGLVRVPTESEANVESPDSVSIPQDALDEALETGRKQIDALTEQVKRLTEGREALEKSQSSQKEILAELKQEFGNIQAALDRVALLMSNDGV